MLKRQPLAIPLFVSLALVGATALLFATPWGIGLSLDSLAYVTAARQLLHGDGYSLPSADGRPVRLTFYPPFFSGALATTGLLGLDPLDGARWLHAFLFGANVVLVGLMIHRSTDRSLPTATVGSLLMLGSVDILRIHTMAWSEPLFLFLTLLGLFSLACHLDSPKTTLLVASSIAIGLGCVTRYAGIAVIATGIVALLLFDRQERQAKLRNGAIFLAISVLPITVWALANLYIRRNPTGRTFVYHPVTMDQLNFGAFTILDWFVPIRRWDQTGSIMSLITAISLLALIVVLWRCPGGSDEDGRRSATIVRVSLLFILTYAAVLIISRSFFGAGIRFDARTLSPAYPPILIAIACLAYRRWRLLPGTRRLRVAAGVLCAVILGASLARGLLAVVELSRDGQGYASRGWRESEIIREVRALPVGVRLYSNSPAAVTFLAGRPAISVPLKGDGSTGLANQDYPARLAALRERLEAGDTVVVWLSSELRAFLPSETELTEALSLQAIERVADGAIYVANGQIAP